MGLNFIFKCNNKVITWQHLRDVYMNGKGADREAPGLSVAHKLRYEHVYLTSFSKMRVDLAAQVQYTCMSMYDISHYA